MRHWGLRYCGRGDEPCNREARGERKTAAVAASLQKPVASPVKIFMRGGDLPLTWAPGEPIRMRGTATHVFKGEIDLEQFA